MVLLNASRMLASLPQRRAIACRCCSNVQHTASTSSTSLTSRRGLLAGLGAAVGLSTLQPSALAAEVKRTLDPENQALQTEAFEAYGVRDFETAVQALNGLVEKEAAEPRWREMRGQALVDGKNFTAAVEDFNVALSLTPGSDPVKTARLLADRALAYEGLSQWEAALEDYNKAMLLAAEAGERIDPYILNSRGNCYASLCKWTEAREDYLASAQLFQQARGFRGRNGSTTPRLDGAVFASSNAALMLAQIGDIPKAIKEMTAISRRAPGSSDMRAALAALQWGEGEHDKAEANWNYACEMITTGCRKYQDPDWLGRIRRWPPLMVEKMTAFLKLDTKLVGRVADPTAA